MSLNKRSPDLLEEVFLAEKKGIHDKIGLFQTKRKLAQKLEDEGYLKKVKIVLGGRLPMTIEGYRLTPMGIETVKGDK